MCYCMLWNWINRFIYFCVWIYIYIYRLRWFKEGNARIYRMNAVNRRRQSSNNQITLSLHMVSDGCVSPFGSLYEAVLSDSSQTNGKVYQPYKETESSSFVSHTVINFAVTHAEKRAQHIHLAVLTCLLACCCLSLVCPKVRIFNWLDVSGFYMCKRALHCSGPVCVWNYRHTNITANICTNV